MSNVSPNIGETKKIYQVLQGQALDKLPFGILERLCQTYWVLIPIGPDVPPNPASHWYCLCHAVSPKHRRKLQKLEGFDGINRSPLLEIARKVYNCRDSGEDRQGKKPSCAVIAAPGEMDKRGNRRNRLGERERKCLGKDQCAYYRQKDQWKNECPRGKEKEENHPALQQAKYWQAWAPHDSAPGGPGWQEQGTYH